VRLAVVCSGSFSGGLRRASAVLGFRAFFNPGGSCYLRCKGASDAPVYCRILQESSLTLSDSAAVASIDLSQDAGVGCQPIDHTIIKSSL